MTIMMKNKHTMPNATDYPVRILMSAIEAIGYDCCNCDSCKRRIAVLDEAIKILKQNRFWIIEAAKSVLSGVPVIDLTGGSY